MEWKTHSQTKTLVVKLSTQEYSKILKKGDASAFIGWLDSL